MSAPRIVDGVLGTFPHSPAAREAVRLALACVLSLAGLSAPSGAAAQADTEARVLAVVDYVSGNEVYLSAGSQQGIQAGDTVLVYDGDGSAAELLGSFAIQSATERRSVATAVGALFTVSKAEVLYLGLPSGLLAARLEESDTMAQAAGPPPEEAPTQEATQEAPKPPPPPVQILGRASFDMDALRTTTRWGDSPEEEIQRTFSTPTFRLQARVQNLPGGLRLGTNMRLSHRTSPDDVIQPVTSLRFYQLDLEKRFESVPLQLHLGRFHNPFDDYSGYLDGVMVHLGEGGLGAGAAVGYEPEFWNEGVSSDRPKASGFLDYTARGESAEYSGAVVFSTLRPRNDEPDRTYMATSHRLRLGNAWIRQRLQLDRSPDGSDWTVSRLQVDATLPLSGSLSLQGGWRRWRPYYPEVPQEPFGVQHDRATMGFSFWSLAGGLAADVSLDRPEGGEQARTVSSSFFVRSTGLLGLGFSGTASYWTRGESRSLLLSPEVRRGFRRGEARVAYRYYSTDAGSGEILTHYADLSLSFPLARTVSARLNGFVQWGDRYSSNRFLVSLWKSF